MGRHCSILPPSVNPYCSSNLIPQVVRCISIFSLTKVQKTLLLQLVTAIGLCSFMFSFLDFGNMVVLDSIQLGCTFSFRHLLKAFTKPFLFFLFFTMYFIVSVFTPSVLAAFPFFCLFIILTRSSSFITGNGIILLPLLAMSSSSSFLISSFSPGLPLVPYQKVQSTSVDFWKIS